MGCKHENTSESEEVIRTYTQNGTKWEQVRVTVTCDDCSDVRSRSTYIRAAA